MQEPKRVACTNCAKTVKLPLSYDGRPWKCPGCGARNGPEQKQTPAPQTLAPPISAPAVGVRDPRASTTAKQSRSLLLPILGTALVAALVTLPIGFLIGRMSAPEKIVARAAVAPGNRVSETPAKQSKPEPPPKQPDPASFAKGLRLHFEFEDCDDKTVNDSSGNEHHGVLVGAASIEDGGLDGKAVRLKKSQDWVRVKHPSLDTTDWEGFSFSAWVKKKRDTTYGAVLSRGMEDGDKLSLGFQQGNRSISGAFGYGGASTYPPLLPKRGSLPLNEWHHMVGTWDGKNLLVYVDGKTDQGEMKTVDNWKDDPNYTLAIGKTLGHRKRWLDSYTNGWIDNFRIYDRALPPSDVEQLFQLKR